MTDITRDARRILVTLYRVYVDRRSTGMSRSASAYFGNSDDLQETVFASDPKEDVADFCWELKRNSYISCLPGDNIANDITLLPDTIVAMEQRFPNGAKQVLNFLSKISGIIPSI